MEEPQPPIGYVEMPLDSLRTAFEDSIAPPGSREPSHLPFGQRSAADFERLILILLEDLDGLRNLRLYGRPGQKQHGIDIHGRDDQGLSVVVQVKRYEEFAVDDLEAAVEEFLKDGRPFDAEVLIVAVACERRDTHVDNKLHELQKLHSDLALRLYDAELLSNRLRNRADLVERTFGPAWAEPFCGSSQFPTPSTPIAIEIAEALVRGPIDALELRSSLDAATSLAGTEPARAAAELQGVIDRLLSKGFAATALPLRAELVDRLIEAEDFVAASEELCALAWDQVLSGVPHWDRKPSNQLRELTKAQDLPIARQFLGIVDSIERWYASPTFDLNLLVERVSGLAGSPAHGAAALWLAETALAEHQIELDGVREQVDLANQQRSDSDQRDIETVRLRLAYADLTGDWDGVVRDARSGRLGFGNAALVYARRGRFLGRSGDVSNAVADYEAAIQQACIAGLQHEAAICVRSSIEVRLASGVLVSNPNEAIRLANAMDPGPGAGHFPGRVAEDAGGAALANDNLIEAIRWYRTALRQAFVRGDWRGEISAHRHISQILQRTGDVVPSTRHAIAGQSSDLLKKLLPASEFIDIESACRVGTCAERATAVMGAALQSSLIPDARVDEFASLALASIAEPSPSPFGPQPYRSGWQLAAGLAPRLRSADALAVLERAESFIPREPNRYTHVDDELAHILARFASDVPAVAERACSALARVVEQGGGLAHSAMNDLYRDSEEFPELLKAAVSRLADDGHEGAIDVLISLGVDHEAATRLPLSSIQGSLNVAPTPPGTVAYGTGLPRTSFRASILSGEAVADLASHCVRLAGDASDVEVNRADAAIAIRNLSDTLLETDRKKCFEAMVALVGSEVAPEPFASSHPLSTFKFNLGSGELSREALLAAACLAKYEDEQGKILELALPMLVQGEPRDVNIAARALHMARVGTQVEERLLEKHPQVWPRQLAVWSARHAVPTRGGVLHRLAGDPDVRVRREVARAARELHDSEPELASRLLGELGADVDWSVRDAVRRARQ